MLSIGVRRNLARGFALLTLVSVLIGAYALNRQSNLVIVFALTPLFAVLALVFGLSSRRNQ